MEKTKNILMRYCGRGLIMYKNTIKLGEILLKDAKITANQLSEALIIQATSKLKIGEILVNQFYVTETEVIKALSYQTGIEFVNLDNYAVDFAATKSISEKLAKRINAIPLKLLNDKIHVAMTDPLNLLDVEDIELESNRKVEVYFAIKKQINDAIEKYMSGRKTEQAAKEVTDENRNYKSAFILNLQDDFVNKSPVVKLINSLINQALKLDASDIHIEPFENQIRVRFRVDGDLHEILTISMQSQSAIITRIKVMANMNIAEKRLPQDGRIEMKVDNLEVDMRISVIPSSYGEKIVMRILNRENFLKSKTELGFTKDNLNLFDNIISAPNGIILISGPTGSGKTTTLYAYLNELNKINKNIITVEDPVEYKLDGINQVQVNSKIGLSFANGLRSILRQDPDIIMIGEIRDEETAEIAIRAAITGHLVLSTIHTNDAPSTIIRLLDMGIKPFLISASLRGVIAQRLVKTICENCKTFYEASGYEKEVLEINDNLGEDYLSKKVILYKGEGCPKCLNTGYKGRIAIHEIMNVNRNVKDAIYQSDIVKLNLALQNNGMKTLKDNCKELVLSGMTTLEEYLQVIYRI